MKDKLFASVWDAIEDTPQAAASLKARSTLMMELSSYIEKHGLTRAQAADLLGVTQSRVSDLIRGRINLFSLDMLFNMATAVGMSPVLKLTKLDTCLEAALEKLEDKELTKLARNRLATEDDIILVDIDKI